MRGLSLFAVLVASTATWAAPLSENLAGRRAVRGAPVETAQESTELRLLRQFDEESFPQPGRGEPPPDPESEAPHTPSAGGTSAFGLGPHAFPAALRSPQPMPAVAETVSAIPRLNPLPLPECPVRLDARLIRYLEVYKPDKRGRAI